MDVTKFYRYEAVEYAVIDVHGEFASPSIPNPKLELRVFNLYKETPKGYWIGYGRLEELHSDKRWVSKTATKRFAYPTQEEALTNFIKRTEKRVKILTRQKLACDLVLFDAKKLLQNG
jgi:hypothetical protein